VPKPEWQSRVNSAAGVMLALLAAAAAVDLNAVLKWGMA